MPCVGGVCYMGAQRSTPQRTAPQRTAPQRSSSPRKGSRSKKAETYGGRSFSLGGGKVTQVPLFQPWQQSFQKEALPMFQQQLQKMLGGQLPTEGFEPIAQQARSQFEQSIPTLAERFSGLGMLQSPALASVIGKGQQELEENLAAQKAQFGLQQQGNIAGLLPQLLQSGLAPQYESQFIMPRPQPQFIPPPQQAGVGGGFASGIGSLLGGLGSLAGAFMPGMGAVGAAGAGLSRLMR